MNWLKNLFGFRKKSAGYSGWFGGLIGAKGSVAEAALQSPTADAAIRWLQVNSLQAEPIVEQRTAEGWKTVTDHPAIEILKAPLRHSQERPDKIEQTYASRMYGAVQDLAIYGNALWAIHETGGGSAVMEWIPWSSVNVRYIGSTCSIDFFQVTTSGATRRILPEESCHIKLRVDPLKPSLGRSPLAAGLDALRQDAAAARYGERMLAAGGIGALLMPKEQGVPDDAVKAATEAVRNLAKGGNGGIGGINGEFQIEKLGYSPEDMALETLLNAPQRAICSMIGVPPEVLGVSAGTETSTYSNVSEAGAMAARSGLGPLWDAIADAMTAAIIREPNVRLRYDIQAIIALDSLETARWKRATDAYRGGLIDRATGESEIGIPKGENSEGWYAYMDRLPMPLDVRTIE